MKLNKADWLKIVGVGLVFITGLIWSYQIMKPERQLPIYNPSELDERLVDSTVQGVGRNHKVLPFALLSQQGDTLTDAEVKGKIRIVDFFFTTCPGICKDMAREIRRLQDVYEYDEDVIFLSHSVTPEIDSLPVIQAYAALQGAINGKWYILTGDKKQIYKLARQSYFAVLDEGGTGDEDDFIHTENFVLVDQQDRIRGFYDGTSREDVDRLVEDLKLLKGKSPSR
jgi:protein SCO1/2